MASYKVIVNKQVRKKDMPDIPAKTRLKVVELIGELRDNPRPVGAVKLTNRQEYRLRAGDYRILYVVNDQEEFVEVRKVAHRREVYRK